MAVAEPAEQLGVARAGPQQLVLAVPVDLLLVTMRHVARGPAVYVAGVPQQLPHFPERAAGDRGVEPGQLGPGLGRGQFVCTRSGDGEANHPGTGPGGTPTAQEGGALHPG